MEYSVQFSLSVVSDSLRPHEFAARQDSAIKNNNKMHLQQHGSPRDYRSKLSKSDTERHTYHFSGANA